MSESPTLPMPHIREFGFELGRDVMNVNCLPIENGSAG